MEAGKSGFDKKTTQIAAISREGQSFYNSGNELEFFDWLTTRPEKFIYAHNLQYDLGNLFGFKLDSLDMVLVGGRLIRAGWRNKIFVDSFNIWPMSAAKIGSAFGLEKLTTQSMATDKEYVFRDVEIIQRAMSFAWKFCESLDIETCPATLGGLCIKVWKALGGENCHDTSTLSREGYYGGRVELFKVCNEELWNINASNAIYDVFSMQASSDILHIPDKENVCWTDINSLYPHVMRKNFPDIAVDFGKKLADYGVARCKVKMPETAIGVLPYRDDEGKVFFPFGTFTGVWTCAELRAAQDRGGKILKVYDSIGSNDFSKPYENFVQTIYAKRLAAKTPAENLFFKLLLNNLYGRLGAGGVIARTVMQNDRNKLQGIPYGKKVLVNYQMPLSDETNWLHAAHVTSYGRLELLSYLELIGADKMIYCDTDSCIFDSPNKKIPFTIGKELGQMKLESWEKCAVTFAPKMYRVTSAYKAKGVPRHLAKTFINTGHAEFELPFKMREALKFYDRNNAKRLSVWRKISKHNKQVYDKKTLKLNRFYPCKIKAG